MLQLQREKVGSGLEMIKIIEKMKQIKIGQK